MDKSWRISGNQAWIFCSTVEKRGDFVHKIIERGKIAHRKYQTWRIWTYKKIKRGEFGLRKNQAWKRLRKF